MNDTMTTKEEHVDPRWMIRLRSYGLNLVYSGDSEGTYYGCEGFSEEGPVLFTSYHEALAKVSELMAVHVRLTICAAPTAGDGQ